VTPLLSAAWLWIASPHFELVTDAGEKKGRQLIARMEQIRAVFSESIGGRSQPLPVRLFLFRSEREFRDYRPSSATRGFFQSGPERDHIVILDAGEETDRVAFHEYVHLVMNHSTAALPLWLEEGTAEFYSTLSWRDGRLSVGSPIGNHVRVLLSQSWLTAAQLEAVTRSAGVYNEASRAGLFYAQSWALAHMLNMGATYGKHMPRFAELLDQATPAPLAFEQAFGRPFEVAVSELRGYVKEGSFRVAEIMTPPFSAGSVSVERAPEERVALAQADLLLTMNRASLAESKLKTLPPSSPEVQTALGLAALARKDTGEALERLGKAMALGSRSGVPYFEYAMLMRDAGAPPAEFRRYLAEAAGRNPNFAEAQFLLGLLHQQEGRHQEAISALSEATRVLPRQSYFWHALAVSHHTLGEAGNARRAARKAAESAASKQELEMAQAALQLAGSGTVEPAPRKPAVVVPDTWKPRGGDTRISGVLEQIDCFGLSARFHIRSNGAAVALWVARPGDVLLRTVSAITFEFSCGPQRPRKVTVDYVARPDAARKTAGEIVALEFQ